jgi:hypothetical protein
MNPSKEHKHDNVTYMLCILSWILSGGWQRSMIKCSKVCPWASKSVKQKTQANSSWYQLVFEKLSCLILLQNGDIGNFSLWVLLISHYG